MVTDGSFDVRGQPSPSDLPARGGHGSAATHMSSGASKGRAEAGTVDTGRTGPAGTVSSQASKGQAEAGTVDTGPVPLPGSGRA